MASPSRRLQTKPVITCLKSVLLTYTFVFWVRAEPGPSRPVQSSPVPSRPARALSRQAPTAAASPLSLGVGHRAAGRGRLGQGEPGRLLLPAGREGHQRALRPGGRRRRRGPAGHLRLLRHLPRQHLDAQAGRCPTGGTGEGPCPTGTPVPALSSRPQYAMLLSLIFLIVLVAAVVGFVFRHEVSRGRLVPTGQVPGVPRAGLTPWGTATHCLQG